MGLFDSYQFNPQSYGGGGLLERLGLNAPLNLPGQGFQNEPTSTMAYGGQQVPVFGRPEAALPPNAQPAQYQAPQQQQEPGFGSQFMAGLQGFGEGGRTGGIIGALTGAASGFSRGETRENQTTKALVAAGLNPELAQTVSRDPGLLRAVLPQLMGTAGRTDDIKEFEYAKRQGYQGGLSDWMAQKRGGAGEYGLTPVMGTGPDGKPALIQLGKNGKPLLTPLPDGFSISRDPVKVEGPTGTTILDPQTRQIVSFIPKDVAGAAKAKGVGKGQGEASLILPQAKTAVDSALRAIDELRNHPGIDVGTGLSSVIDPRSWIPGQSGYDFSAKNQQAKGKSFMVAREALKGAGQVTDFEGTKGEQAIANLDAAQSKEQYLKALDELERMLKASYADLQTKAGNGSASVGAPGADLRKKYGLE